MSGLAIFLFGLVSSVHCLAMCGGIFAASQARPSRVLCYNLGRLLSYGAAGAAAGALGSLASVSDSLRALAAIAGGFLVAAIGCTMLGLFPALRRLSPALPKSILKALLGGGRGAFATGLLTVLLPCAPLQTMLLVALARGSALKGGAAMLAFVAGTLPALVGAGAAYSKLASNARLSRRVTKAAAVLVIAMGAAMAFRGLVLTGLPARAASLLSIDAQIAKELPSDASIAISDGTSQRVVTEIEPMAFHPIVVQRGLPVAWTIRARRENLNEHSSTFSIPDLGVKKTLEPGDTRVEFVAPDRSGAMEYCSWCAMISSRIYIVEDLNKLRANVGNRVARAGKDAAR